MTNLLRETHAAIKNSGHQIKDVTFIGSDDGKYTCTWAQFKILADRKYDSGFGAPEVAEDLVIRFGDGKHMWRVEYDGSENWTYDTPRNNVWSGEPKPINELFSTGWRTLHDLNEVES